MLKSENHIIDYAVLTFAYAIVGIMTIISIEPAIHLFMGITQ